MARNMMWMITGFAIVVERGKGFVFTSWSKLSHGYPNCERAHQLLSTHNE